MGLREGSSTEEGLGILKLLRQKAANSNRENWELYGNNLHRATRGILRVSLWLTTTKKGFPMAFSRALLLLLQPGQPQHTTKHGDGQDLWMGNRIRREKFHSKANWHRVTLIHTLFFWDGLASSNMSPSPPLKSLLSPKSFPGAD